MLRREAERGSSSVQELRAARARRDMQRVQQLAREVFGYDRLHPGQAQAIRSVVEGHDTLLVMPTGAGKSAIYQIATLVRLGPALVISPLIALQRDQLRALEEVLPGRAALVNSTLSAGEREATLAAFAQGELDFLFLAPEQLSGDVLGALAAARPALFVVDEAHCISEWGHDFRPEYLQLGAAVEALGHPTVLALTATAAPPVREEIVTRLGMRDPHVLVFGFDRPNLLLGVRRYDSAGSKRAALLDQAQGAPTPGIVYTATRKGAEDCASDLAARGLRAAAYHGGLGRTERADIEAAFQADALDVIVATTAFGMGIDKPDVRFVYHLDIPGSVDAYYQEIGRAGRDGAPAEATLFFTPDDLRLRRFFAGSGRLEADQAEEVLRTLEALGGRADPEALREASSLSKSRLHTALSRLEELGAVTQRPDGEVQLQPDVSAARAAEDAAEAQAHHVAFEQSRLDMMRGYAETQGCRRAYLLSYFGEAFTPPCGHCDQCLARPDEVLDAQDAQRPFPVGSAVTHRSFGRGLVVRYEAEKVTVLFDELGYQTLALGIALDNGLLTAL